MTRDERQKRVLAWVHHTFGALNAEVHERVLRLFEEVVELAQAEQIPKDSLHRLIAHVYRKIPGAPAQEVGGIGTTLLAYCESKGLSADDEEKRELERVLAIDPDHFRKRHNVKAAAGVAAPVPAGLLDQSQLDAALLPRCDPKDDER